jgi:hypothetical protein
MSLCYDFQKWTMITFGLVATSLVVGLFILMGKDVYGQTNSTNAQSPVNFLKATNNKTMNFSILFPSNWQLSENFEDSETLGNRVSFEIPDRNLSRFIINTKKVEPYLDTDTMTLKNTSLQQLVQQELNIIQEANKTQELNKAPFVPAIEDFKIIRQNAVTIGGNPGWKFEFKYSWHGDPYYSFVIHTIANGKIYTLTYEDDSLKVPETLPLINKMVESFQFIK